LTFTVTVAGPERHDGETGYTYVLTAPDETAARRLVMAYHAASHGLRLAEVRIDAETGPRLRTGFDPAQRPDVVYVPAQSFPGPPTWPADERGRAWNDLRPPEQRAEILAAIAAENERLETARAFGIPVAAIDIDATDDPAMPAPVTALHAAQRLARRALAPGRVPVEGDAITALLVGMPHIHALVTAIDDRDLANGVGPDDIGQVLLDANYQAANAGQGGDEEPPEYLHRRLVIDDWSLLKAADCYRFQVTGAPGTAAPAAHAAVDRLRAALIDTLSLDEDTYRLRYEWDAADGWPLLDSRPARERRAEALIECYQQLDGIEQLHPAEWGQHISDMIADLLHYANTEQDMDAWDRLDMAVRHFTEEVRQIQPAPATEPQPEPSTLRLLVATSTAQGRHNSDFCRTLPGEIVFPPLECPHCYDPAEERNCHTLLGAESGRATTTFTVAEVPISIDGLHRVLAKAWGLSEDDIEASDISDVAAQMIAVASRFPIGAVLGKSARRYRRRLAAPAPPADPPTRWAGEPDAAQPEPRAWTVRIRERYDYQFTVQARDENEAREIGWDQFGDSSQIIGHDSDIHVALAA